MKSILVRVNASHYTRDCEGRRGCRARGCAVLVGMLIYAGGASAGGGPATLRILGIRSTSPCPNDDGSGYSVVTTNTPAGTERRFYRGGHHFLSLVDNGGTFNLRPHPGMDLNGWGGSIYFQPYFYEPILFGARVIGLSPSSGGVLLSATGVVCRGASASYGRWETTLLARYEIGTKRVFLDGSNTITLAGTIADAGGDLNLYLLANNYLDDVPLLRSGVGDTGDMTNAVAVGHNFTKEWVPPMGGYFPQDWTYSLTVTAFGNYNEVDTAAQGFCPIQAAYKPTIRVNMATAHTGIPMIFGARYDTNAAQDFSADNVGITPLVLPATSATQFVFAVSIEADALAGDGVGVAADLVARFSDEPDHADIFYTPDLREPFRRLVGILPRVSPGEYAGEVIVPYPPEGGPNPERGFFIAGPPCQPPAAEGASAQSSVSSIKKAPKRSSKSRRVLR